MTRIRTFPTLTIVLCIALALKVNPVYKNSSVFFSDIALAEETDSTAKNAPNDNVTPDENQSLTENVVDFIDDGGTEEFDPFTLTKSEIELLQALSQRRIEIESREKALEFHKEMLFVTEKRIDQKIKDLQKIEKFISTLIIEHDEQQKKKLASLVKIYETMKPKSAAAIFETLDLKIVLDVAELMKEAKLALVLEVLTPERAKQITTELRIRRDIPFSIRAQ